MEILSVFFLGLILQTSSITLRGVVRTQEGQPRVGAEVFVVSPGVPGLRKAEVLRGKTGKRGRFHLRLHPGRIYWAWSHFKDEKGLNYLSKLEKGILPGRILILQENQKRLSQTLQLKNLDVWGKPEEMKVAWDLDGRRSWVIPTPIGSKSDVIVPDQGPMSSNGLEFSLLSASGTHLFHGRIWIGSRVRRSVWKAIFGAGKEKRTLTFKCPTPKTLSISVRDREKKKPIANAKIFYNFGNRGEYISQKTDENGKALLRFPDFRSSYRSLAIYVEKEGFSGSNAFINRKRTSIQGEYKVIDPKKPLKEVVFSLGKDEPFSGKVIGLEGKAITGAVIRWKSFLYERKEGNTTWGQKGRNGFLPVRADGSFQISSLPSNLTGMELFLYLSESGWKSLFGQRESPPLPAGSILSWKWYSYRNKTREALFNLGNYRFLPLRVLGPDGGPVSFSKLVWRKGHQKKIQTIVGRRGKGFLLLPKGERACFFGFKKGVGYFVEEEAQAPDGEFFVASEKTLNLKKFETFLEGKVVDRKGTPLKGVTISPVGWSIHNGNSRTYAIREINDVLIESKTDANGRFSIPFLEDSHLKINVSFIRKGGSKTIKVGEAQSDLEIRL
jgi:hypothetical protein